MNDLLVWKIIESRAFPDEPEGVELIETHISWVILTKHFAYKIKKPIHYSFLDFSTMGMRKFYCEQEVNLNRRLTEDMYLAVVPILKDGGEVTIEGTSGDVIDYAVKMKRMDNSRQMNLMLEKGEVTRRHLYQLAEKLAAFHIQAEPVKTPPDIEVLQNNFNDLQSVKDFVRKEVGEEAAEKMGAAIELSDLFLKTHFDRLCERHRLGFTIDGHGDLHSKNILLLDEPVVFDCIEFSPHLRQGDVLNELAFFCMDLDAYGRNDLAGIFMEKYLKKNPCLLNDEDQYIFQYFKMYRANVRLKVNALKAMQAEEKTEGEIRLGLVKKYLGLLDAYRVELSEKAFSVNKV